ncbi:unnamed protein product [Leptosia nina]|uniref:Thyroglobulin type-1 domain-containing protein n=1 Tax=Leptosia nina TaxID=320188 RepID=A0AAV1J1Z4_9NEOP
MVPVLSLDNDPTKESTATTVKPDEELKFLPFIMLINQEEDTSEFWRETEMLSLVRNNEMDIDYERCEQNSSQKSIVQFPSRRIVRPICRSLYELDQSCVQDEYNFDSDEFLPVTTLDFRAGCNPYWGHPEQEYRALRCDKILRRCVPVNIPLLPNETLTFRRSFRFDPPSGGSDCPVLCTGYDCQGGLLKEVDCTPGAFLPDKDQCNCCGRCSAYQQLNQKCAEFKKTVHIVNGSKETEVEEEFLEPGCDDGLVCRQGFCQDIHTVQIFAGRRKRDEGLFEANEPCKREMKQFKKKYGKDGHLHYNAPQCTPLWLYAPVQCRRFVCYCALEDGTFIDGIKVPRVEVSNMNCDCAREKCRTGSQLECDGYGNYKEAVFTSRAYHWGDYELGTSNPVTLASRRTGYEAALPTEVNL